MNPLLHLGRLAAAASFVVAAACGCASNSRNAAADAAGTVDIVLLPNAGASAELASGCWATFFDERSFNGNSLTLVGPVDLQTLDKGTAQQLKRDIKSVATGPRATLLLYERQFLSARSVGFTPDSREAGLVEKLGFGGRIQSLSLHCS